MESFVETIREFIKELNIALPLNEKKLRNAKIAKVTTQFYLNSRKWVKELGLGSLDKIAIFNSHNERNFFQIVERFDVKSPKIIELSNELFFDRSLPIQAETIFATLISTFNEIDYYKKNNLYPREFIKDIIVISFLIRITTSFPRSIEEGRLRATISFLPSFDRVEYHKAVCSKIDNYLIKRAPIIAEDIDDLSNIVDAFIATNEINSVDNLIELLGIAGVNNNRIGIMISELMEYESKGVALNFHLISGNILKTMLLTITDFPLYLDNEEDFHNIIVRMAIIIKGLYMEIEIEK